MKSQIRIGESDSEENKCNPNHKTVLGQNVAFCLELNMYYSSFVGSSSLNIKNVSVQLDICLIEWHPDNMERFQSREAAWKSSTKKKRMIALFTPRDRS